MNRSLRVLLLGYYGQGNFGDDILLKVAHGLVRDSFPSADISVLVQNEAGSYVKAMLGGDVTVLLPARHGHFDLIVHGGGGVFFDFKRHGLKSRFIEWVLFSAGQKAYLSLENLVRKIAGKQATSSQLRLGIGVGVGTFSKGSCALRDRLRVLADMDALWLRDDKSLSNLNRFKSIMHAELLQSTDLAFMHQHWCATKSQAKIAAKPKLGVILRDWNQSENEQKVLSDKLQYLSKKYELTAILFDAGHDPMMQKIMADYNLQIWQPKSQDIAEFSAMLAAQDVLISSRAHGAICGACLIVPSVIVEIEPKLRAIHNMLPNSSVLIGADDVDSWDGAIEKARAISSQAITKDVESQRSKAEASLLYLQQNYLTQLGDT